MRAALGLFLDSRYVSRWCRLLRRHGFSESQNASLFVQATLGWRLKIISSLLQLDGCHAPQAAGRGTFFGGIAEVIFAKREITNWHKWQHSCTEQQTGTAWTWLHGGLKRSIFDIRATYTVNCCLFSHLHILYIYIYIYFLFGCFVSLCTILLLIIIFS